MEREKTVATALFFCNDRENQSLSADSGRKRAECMAQNKTIGIIGGMGPMATVDLFRKIVDLTDSDTDRGHLRVVIDSNTNIADRTAAILHGGEDPLPEMVRAALNLERMGADVLVMGCNTAHYFYPDICRFVRTPFLNMLEETAKEAKRRGYSAVALLATDGTVRSGVYEQVFEKEGVALVTPEEAEQKEVMALIYEGIKAGKTTWDTAKITAALENLARQGAKAVVLGCTELPLAFPQYGIESPLPLLDPTEIVARSAITFVGGKLRKG